MLAHKCYPFFLPLVLFLFFANCLYAQTDNADLSKLTPKEFSIPVSPLFDMMAVAPSMVAKTDDIRDFKVDWSFKSWKLSPNLAIQSQPIWQAFYQRKKIEKYQNASLFARRLSTLDVSVGTVQNEDNDRRIGGAFKMNLYRSKDPLMVKGAYDAIEYQYNLERERLLLNEKRILKLLDSITTPSVEHSLRASLANNDLQLSSIYVRRNEAIRQQSSVFVADNWNASYIDIAFGRIFTYKTDSTGSLSKLRIDRNTGNALWINFGKGIGKRGLISGLIRTSFYEEELTFNIMDDATQQVTTQTAIAGNKLYSIGVNYRYGGPVFNIFMELIKEGKTLKTPIAALNDAFKTPTGKTIVVESVKWNKVLPYNLNFGGDWRISRNVVLNYGIRVVMDENFRSKQIIPIANISCMMR